SSLFMVKVSPPQNLIDRVVWQGSLIPNSPMLAQNCRERCASGQSSAAQLQRGVHGVPCLTRSARNGAGPEARPPSVRIKERICPGEYLWDFEPRITAAAPFSITLRQEPR